MWMEIVANAIVAVGLHEIGHIAMASALGVRVYRVGISWKGPFIHRDVGTDAQNLAITLAGPAINLLLALAFYRIQPGFALSNLVLGACNLFPSALSDGSRALRLFQAIRKPLPILLGSAPEIGTEKLAGAPGGECRGEVA
jgi:Zn-dependent protease